MKLTLIKDYSNYYNRIIKREDYNTIITNNTYKVLEKINFITGDDIRTSQVINWTENWDPNYLVVSADGSNDIISRWYVIDHNKTRRNQYVITLKRDLVAENYDSIITSPAYIERGVLTNTSDPSIFNSENISTNQIKQWERPIMEIDPITNEVIPYNWIVGYCQKQPNDTADWNEESVQIAVNQAGYSDWDDVPYHELINTSNVQSNKETFLNPMVFASIPYLLNWSDGNLNRYFYITVSSYNNPNLTWHNTQRYPRLTWEDTNGNDRTSSIASYWIANYTSGNKWINSISYRNNATQDFIKPTDYTLSRNQMSQISYSNWYRNNTPKFSTSTVTSNISNYLFNHSSSMSAIDSAAKHNKNVYYGTYTSNGYSYINEIRNLNGTTIKVGNDYYKWNVTIEDDVVSFADTEVTDNGLITSIVTSDGVTGVDTVGKIAPFLYGAKATVSLTPTSAPSLMIKLEDTSGNGTSFKDIVYLTDAPYAMFAIPVFNEWYNENTLGKTYTISAGTMEDDTWTEITHTHGYSVSGFPSSQYIANNLQSGSYLIDLQLLPYCPFNYTVYKNGSNIDIRIPSGRTKLKLIKKLNLIKAPLVKGPELPPDVPPTPILDDDIFNIVMFGTLSDWNHIGVIYDGSSQTTVEYNTLEDLKVANQSDIYRLNSPSKSKYYDFNAAKNYGLSTFSLNGTYKPFSPFIYVRPTKNSGSLYGGNYDDYIGLIATGDYVIPTTTDAWKQYQINNKNYQQIFDRQIQHQTFSNNWAVKEQEYANKANIRNATVGGAMSGGLSGAMVGAKAGSIAGPYGAIAGGVLGGAAGAFGLGSSTYDLVAEGAALDMDRLISTNTENISYARDMFNYNLQNIQALPDALVATSSFDCINKVYPFVEYFSCSSYEKEQIRSLLTLQGMSVNKVTTIDTLSIGNSTSFTKATLYKFIGDTSNPVIVNEINAELLKGVYL